MKHIIWVPKGSARMVSAFKSRSSELMKARPWLPRFVEPKGLAGDKHDARQYFNSFVSQCGKVAGG